MAFTAGTCWEVESGGDDTNNGGGFDPTNANFATDLTIVSGGNTASPVVSSASYNFLSRDIANWLFLPSGTFAGWYKITSVASNQATLTADVGTAVLYPSYTANTTAGINASATASGITWGLDYSQGVAASINYADMAIDGTTNTKFTSAANPVGPHIVGNVISVTSGTGFTVQRVQVASVSGTTATCDKSLGTLSSTGGHGGMGGALASSGQAGALHVAGNTIWEKLASYSITSASSNVSGGCLTLTAGVAATATRFMGYGTLRGDGGRPTHTASGISTFSLLTPANETIVANVILDAAGLAGGKTLGNPPAGALIVRVWSKNATTATGASSASVLICCEFSGASVTPISGGMLWFCTSHGNSGAGFSLTNATGNSCFFCVSYGNTGASTDGFVCGSAVTAMCLGCVAYNNGRDGFRFTAGAVTDTLVNCISAGNVGNGFGASAAFDGMVMFNCATYNNGTAVSTNISAINQIGNIVCTADPFNNAAGGDFSLNNSAGGGALLRAAGIPGATGLYTLPPGTTLSYLDVGAGQHQDSGPLAKLISMGVGRGALFSL